MTGEEKESIVKWRNESCGVRVPGSQTEETIRGRPQNCPHGVVSSETRGEEVDTKVSTSTVTYRSYTGCEGLRERSKCLVNISRGKSCDGETTERL